MTIELTRAQLVAFMALIGGIIIVSLAPVVITGIRGQVIPDSLIAVSDKTVTGLVGVLGTLVGVMWQGRPHGQDEAPATAKRAAQITADAAQDQADAIGGAA